MNRKLDAEIARTIFNYKLVNIGKDYTGKNESSVLCKDGIYPKNMSMPRIGKVDESFLCPNWSSDILKAMTLAKKVKLDVSIKDISLDAEIISKMALDKYISDNS